MEGANIARKTHCDHRHAFGGTAVYASIVRRFSLNHVIIILQSALRCLFRLKGHREALQGRPTVGLVHPFHALSVSSALLIFFVLLFDCFAPPPLCQTVGRVERLALTLDWRRRRRVAVAVAVGLASRTSNSGDAWVPSSRAFESRKRWR